MLVGRKLLLAVISVLLVLFAAGCGGSSDRMASETPEQYKLNCKSLPYNQLVRNPDNYKGTKITYSGKVTQVMEKDGEVGLGIDVNEEPANTVWVNYSRPSGQDRILEGDIIEFWGEVKGLKSFTTASGKQVAVPELNCRYVSITPKKSMPAASDTPANATPSQQVRNVSDGFSVSFGVFVQNKDRINTEIIALAGNINSRLNAGLGLRNSQDLRIRAKHIADEALANYSNLSSQSCPQEYTAAKRLLLQLFELERIRAGSLYNGLVEASDGSDYTSSFGVGTTAAYKYDEVQAFFINECAGM